MASLRSVHRGVRHTLQAYEILSETNEPLPAKELSPLINKRFNEHTTSHSVGWYLRHYGREYGVKSRAMGNPDRRRWGHSTRCGGKVYLFYIK